MRDLLPQIARWQDAGKSVALATVVKVYGSAPRPLGSKMIVSSAGEMAGSVSGGCVESAVIQEGLGVLATGRPKLVEYGIADEWAQTVGLACGGNIEVFVEPIGDGDAAIAALREALENEELVAQAIVLAGENMGDRLLVWPDGRREGGWGTTEVEGQVLAAAARLLAEQRSERILFEAADESWDTFIETFPPPHHLIIVGAVHIAIPLVDFARTLGFTTTVVDARSVFATPERFAHADHLLLGWPDVVLPQLHMNEGAYVAVLSHDDKLDIPALQAALASRARYIGALGSRKTMARRANELRDLGVDETALGRIHNPIGLDLGGRSAEEMALAIMAEIVAVRNGKG
ncbi:MAG: XdhC family protein [Caldilineales bacterium]|nr:XdhC family protein [Caldilineales bacterium]